MLHYRTLPQLVLDVILGIRPDVLNDTAPRAVQYGGESPGIQLRKQTHQIKAEAIDSSTGKVDYAYLKNSAVYRDYRSLTALLSDFDLQTLVGREQKLAFWLNLYNVLVIDAVIHFGIRRSITEMLGFFRRAAYCVGGCRFCLDDIEHGILRANAGHPFIPGPQFGKNDPRHRFVVEQIDYRIHFALVCGAVSCPPVNFFDEDKIETQLDLTAANFLNQNVEIFPHRHVVKLSRLLQWYGEDFGAGAWVKLGFGDRIPLLRTIKSHIVNETKRAFIEANLSRLKVQFESYNWSLNAL